MATAQDAELILKLYELRTEETMRKARNFVIMEFFPTGIADVQTLFANREQPELNAYFRQATTYWEMAAAMVNRGAIDRDLFFDTNGEFFAIWAKISDFIEDLRKLFGVQYLVNLEKLVQSHPNGAERVKLMKERFAKMAEQRAGK
jgi:hypothetical protein